MFVIFIFVSHIHADSVCSKVNTKPNSFPTYASCISLYLEAISWQPEGDSIGCPYEENTHTHMQKHPRLQLSVVKLIS